jgi:hypothetical protein
MTSRTHHTTSGRDADARQRLYGDPAGTWDQAAREADQPVSYSLTPQAEEELALADEAEADWAGEWDDADSNAYQARVEAGLELEADG